MQRKAAMDFMAMEGMLVSPLSTPLGRSIPKSVNLPVLEPSVFHDDGQEGWTIRTSATFVAGVRQEKVRSGD
jgi:hypothetical protein